MQCFECQYTDVDKDVGDDIDEDDDSEIDGVTKNVNLQTHPRSLAQLG
jgi:hypothetical protein